MKLPPHLRVIDGGRAGAATSTAAAPELPPALEPDGDRYRLAPLRHIAQLSVQRMDDLIVALRVLGAREAADDLTRIRDAWCRNAAQVLREVRR